MKTVDVAVLLAYLAGIVGFGLWCARKTKTTDAFMSAGHDLPGWAIGLSIFGSYISSISFLANPGATFRGDWNPFAFTLATPLAAVVAIRYFVPFYRRTGAVSAYEHLEHRFGNWARTYVVVCYLLTQMARTGTIVYLLGLAVSPLIGWSVETVIVVTAVVMTSYIVLGGIEAAVWTGVVQGIVLMLGPLVCVFVLLTAIDGGAATVIDKAAAEGKLGLGSFGPSLAASTFWVVFVYGIVINLQNFAIDQGYVQRYVTARTVREAQKSVAVGGLLYVPVAALFFFIGTALWVFYAQHPARLAGLDAATQADKVFPQFIVHEVPTGLTGLVIAAIFAAAMDSSLNSMATLTLCDLYKRYLRPAAGEKESLRVLHLSTLVWGVAALGVALWMVRAGDVLQVWWTMAGVFGGGMLGLFLLGRWSPRTASGHALAGVAAGVAVILWMTLSPTFPALFGGLVSPFHPLLAIVFGTITILGVGLLLTALAPARRLVALPVASSLAVLAAAAEPPPPRTFEVPEARQAVAVGERHFYAIGNRVIAKYDKQSGRRLAAWEGPEDGPIEHLNSGVVVDGRLYCAHSNYPDIPMTGSVEIWDAETLAHVGSHSFGVGGGSLTWVDRHAGSWWAGFAHYSGDRAEPGRDTSWTQVVQLDDRWQRLQAWVFPPEVIDRFRPMSNSGASWGTDGLLYCTGHDHNEVYAMRLPAFGSTLELVRVVPVASFGQGIAWDRTPGTGRDLWGIIRDQRAVTVTRVPPVSP